ncbi:hypothetical protein GGI21_006025, partial [Coemansia aciculifera]
GSPEDMHESLNERLAKLPADTLVYAGHEYTNSNLRFARSVDPDNQELKEKAERCAKLACTMPSSIAEELATNPFMRVDQPALQIAASRTSAIDVLGELRRMKDNF